MLNMDFSKRVVMHTAKLDWVPSPSPGVWRKPLAREEAERGHATSIVRYEPGASFTAHDHPLGEEILVLEGTFSDATGDFAAGTYFRNPPGFRHAPFSHEGCTILVKLHQFQPDDRQRIAITSDSNQWPPGAPSSIALHEFGDEKVALEKWHKGDAQSTSCAQGEERYVLSGQLQDANARYEVGTWARNPPGYVSHWLAIEDSVVWVKSGHLGD